MSYTSESALPKSAHLQRLEELVAVLNYRKVQIEFNVPNLVSAHIWYDEKDYRSYSGVELDIYRTRAGRLKVTTRSTVARSHWDLIHQNKTLKLIRDMFGGHFTTDAGRNRYWRPDGPPPSPLASGCYMARWNFHNGLGKAQVYLMNRKFEGQNAPDKPSALSVIDQFNPRLLSNNFLLPYIIAVWEEYFRATFAAALRYTTNRELALKRARLSHGHLEQVALGAQSVEAAVAESFSFQRPSAIVDTFRLLDPKLDLGSALRKPFRRRKTSLLDSLEQVVEARHDLVHTGRMNLRLFDTELKGILSDVEAAVDRVYAYVAKHYGFTPSYDF